MKTINTYRTITVLITLFLFFSFSGKSKPKAENSIHYEVSIDKESRQKARIKASLILEDSTIKMASWGHPWLQHGWATFVKDLKVMTEKGKKLKPILVEKNGWGKWKVNAPNGTKLNISYEVHFNHSDYNWDEAGGIDSRPEVTPKAHFLVSKALFIYSPGTKNANIQFNIPSEWSVATNWEKVDDHQYFANSWINLINNSLVIGFFNKKVISNGEMKLILAIDQNLNTNSEIFNSVLQKQLDEFSRIFNGTPKQNYLISIREADVDDGESFHDSFNQVIVNKRIEERFVIWANTMGHEMFHYWNGNFFLVGEVPENFYWFTEGFTEYYSSLSLMRTKVISQSTYLKKLEHYISRYIITKTLWPTDQISLEEAGKEKQKNWLLIYGGGAVVALALDIEIRNQTNNRKSLDDVMLFLKNKYGNHQLKITTKNVMLAVNEISGKNFTPFFEKYVLGKDEILDIEDILLKAGLYMDRFSDEIFLSKDKNKKEILFDKMIHPNSQ